MGEPEEDNEESTKPGKRRGTVRTYLKHALKRLLQPDRELGECSESDPQNLWRYITHIDPLDILEGVLVLPPV